MRQAHREYPFDWMLYSAFSAAARLKDGSDKEYRYAVECVPYFRGILDAVFSAGKPGQIFLKLAARYFENVSCARERGKKAAITTFCFSPTILYAFDVVPICLEVLTAMMSLAYERGSAEFLDYCNQVGFTETSCSSQRGALGAYLAGVGAPIDMVVNDTPGVCDTNANAFAFAAAFLDKPFFQLDFPPVLVEGRSAEYHREDYKALVSFLEEQTGRRLDIDRLREVVQEVHRQDEMISELDEYARIVPNPLPVLFIFLAYAGRFLFAGMPECTELLESMLAVAASNAERGVSGISSGEEKARALFCYIDHYSQNLRMWQLLDSLGITQQASILSTHWAPSSPLARDPARAAGAYRIGNARTNDLDDLLDNLASINSRMPMVKSIRGPYDAPNMWLEDALALAKLQSADFIVYSGTPGCRNTWGMVKLFVRDTEKAGFPTHVINADGFDERVQSWQATRERFEEFLSVRRLLP